MFNKLSINVWRTKGHLVRTRVQLVAIILYYTACPSRFINDQNFTIRNRVIAMLVLISINDLFKTAIISTGLKLCIYIHIYIRFLINCRKRLADQRTSCSHARLTRWYDSIQNVLVDLSKRSLILTIIILRFVTV